MAHEHRAKLLAALRQLRTNLLKFASSTASSSVTSVTVTGHTTEDPTGLTAGAGDKGKGEGKQSTTVFLYAIGSSGMQGCFP